MRGGDGFFGFAATEGEFAAEGENHAVLVRVGVGRVERDPAPAGTIEEM